VFYKKRNLFVEKRTCHMDISRCVSSIIDTPSIAQSWRSRKRTQSRFRIRKVIRILGQRRGIKRTLRMVSTNRLTRFDV